MSHNYVVLTVGNTGGGKSSVSSLLTKNPKFKSYSGYHPETNCTTVVTAEFCTPNPFVATMVDTPGLNDPRPGLDTQHVAELIATLKQLQFFNLLLFVIKDGDRFDQPMRDMVQHFVDCFGSNMFTSCMFVVTRWATDEKAMRNRTRQTPPRTEQSVAADLNQQLKAFFNVPCEVPVSFVDCLCGPEDPEYATDVGRFLQQVEVQTLTNTPFQTKDAVAAQALKDKMEQEKRQAEERAAAEARKAAEAEAQRAKMAQEAQQKAQQAAAKAAELEAAKRAADEARRIAEADAAAARQAAEAAEAAKKAEEERQRLEKENHRVHHLNGRRVHDVTTGAVSLVFDGLLHHIPNPHTYANLFRDSNYMNVDATNLPHGEPLTHGAFLIGGNNTGVYLASNGVKRGITSENAFNAWGFAWGKVHHNHALWESIPMGPAHLC